MAEIAKMIDAIVCTVESWSGALNALTALHDTSGTYEYLVKDHSVCKGTLTSCSSIFQMAREDAISETVFDAAAMCAKSGARLATPQEIREAGKKQNIWIAKLDWDRIKGRYDTFRNNVRLLHDLAQGLLANHLIETTSSIERLLQHQTQFHGLFDRQTLMLDSLHSKSCVCNQVLDIKLGPLGAEPDIECASSGSTFMHDALQHQAARQRMSDWCPSISRASSFTFDQMSISTSQNFGVAAHRYSSVTVDPSMTDSTITVTHEDKPRYIAARAKYDTGSDVNFTSSAFVTENGLSPLLEKLDQPETFEGLDKHESHVKHIIVLHWCAATMHKTRTTTFFVADEVPYDILLGNEFIVRNRVFEPQRTVLALRYKHRSTAQPEEEDKIRKNHEVLATQEQQRTRNEDALKRAQEREAKKKAKLQTSASSMSSSHASTSSRTNTPTISEGTVDTLVKVGGFRRQMTDVVTGNSIIGGRFPSAID